MELKIYSQAEVQAKLATLPNWKYQVPTIEAEYVFPDFKQAMVFVQEVAKIAEETNHHPDIRISYKTVNLSLCTHDVGDKITDLDITVAKKVHEVFQK